MSEVDLFGTHLAFDRWFSGFADCGGDGDVLTVIPAAPGHFEPGSVFSRPWFDWDARPCGMLKDDRCSIHAHKPRECRWAYCSAHPEEMRGGTGADHRERIARAWARPAARRYARWLWSQVAQRYGYPEEQG